MFTSTENYSISDIQEGDPQIGVCDGVNQQFKLTNKPVGAASVRVFYNGQRQRNGKDYALDATNKVITFISPPQVGDAIDVDYRSRG
jgi:hypothetical protein